MTAQFSLARRLKAGETVHTGWCPLPYPIVAETLGREGFPAVTIDQQHGLWDTAGDGDRHRRDPGGRRRADRAHPGRRLRGGEPRARHGRRGRDRADDQHGRGRAGVRVGREVSAGRRAQLGPAARHDARRHGRHEGLPARGERAHRHVRDDRDAHRDRQPRRHRGDRGHRRAVRRPVRPVDRADRRRRGRAAFRHGRARARPRGRGGAQAQQGRRGSTAPTRSAPCSPPSAASASSRSAATSASCAPARRRSSRR